MKKRILIVLFSSIVFILFICAIINEKNKAKIEYHNQEETTEKQNKSSYKFDLSLIKQVNNLNSEENYLISPYSIEIALNMLKEGANGNTYQEIENIVETRYINDISIKSKVSVANALFISKKYKNLIEKDFLNKLTNKYSSDIIYDKFESPKLINKWVKKKTNGMIEKLLDEMDPDFVLGLANALAIDVEWASSFECNNTNEYPFYVNNNKSINVEMMFQKYEGGIEYFETDQSKGVIIPYKKYNSKTGKEISDKEKGKQLEFVGILPSDDINSYINNLTEQDIKDIDNNKKSLNSKESLALSIPRFKYDYSLDGFSKVLNNLGMQDSFNPTKADFTKIISVGKVQENIYVSQAIHKTHIEFNEKGTKAAAVTYFGLAKGAMMLDDNIIEMKFDKPFIYLIRDKETKELLFFGAVYEPNLWNGTTCSE